VRLEAQKLNFTEPVFDLVAEMPARFGRKIEGRQFNQMTIQRGLQAENSVFDKPFGEGHYIGIVEFHLTRSHGPIRTAR
jgi:hypothetical protein